MTFKPAHKQDDPAHMPGQIRNDVSQDVTLSDYIERKTRHDAFNEVNKEKEYMRVVNHPNFRCANGIVHFAEKMLIEIGMSRADAHNWIRAWASTAGDGSQ